MKRWFSFVEIWEISWIVVSLYSANTKLCCFNVGPLPATLDQHLTSVYVMRDIVRVRREVQTDSLDLAVHCAAFQCIQPSPTCVIKPVLE